MTVINVSSWNDGNSKESRESKKKAFMPQEPYGAKRNPEGD